MRKIVVLILCGLLLIGCSPKSEYCITVLAPKGAPSIALANSFSSTSSVRTVDGAEVLQASLINPNPEYDIIIAPINLGCKLIQNGKSKYRLYGVLTWGNLYIVGKKAASFDSLISFGQGGVTEKVFNVIKDEIGYSGEVTYYSSVSEVASLIINTDVKCGVVAEPVLSKILQANKDVEIMFDIQKEYENVTGYSNYPQAAIFVYEENYKNNEKDIKQFIDNISLYLKDNDAKTILEDLNALEKQYQDLIGINLQSLTSDSISRCNLNYQNATDVKDEIERFLKMFGIESINDCLLQEK